jgi:hypothetical protein
VTVQVESTSSVQVAPGSTKVLPSAMLMVADQERVMVGAIESITETVLRTGVALFPELSEAL